MHPIGFQLLTIGQKGMIDVLVLKNTNRQLNLSILCTQGPLSEKHSRFILTQTHTTLKESDILDCPLHVDLQCSLIKKIFLPASPCVWWCYGGFIQCMVQNKKHQEHTEQQISPWASKIKWFRLLKCVCVCVYCTSRSPHYLACWTAWRGWVYPCVEVPRWLPAVHHSQSFWRHPGDP